MSEAEFQSFVAETLGAEATCEPNEDDTFRLCQSPLSILDQTPAIEFFTFDIEAGELTYEGEVAGGPVRWLDNYHIEVRQSVGIVKKEQERIGGGETIDVRTGKAVQLQ